MELLGSLTHGLAVSLVPGEPHGLFHRRLRRHAHRRAAGHRACGDDVTAAPRHLCDVAGGLDHHAGRHLLRRDVWRFDDIHPRQHPGRGRVRRYVPGWLPDGARGPRGPRAGYCRLWIVHRGNPECAGHHRAGSPTCPDSPALRPARDLRRAAPGIHAGHASQRRFEAPHGGHGAARHAPGHGGHRPYLGGGALHLRDAHAERRRRPGANDHGALWGERGLPQH